MYNPPKTDATLRSYCNTLLAFQLGMPILLFMSCIFWEYTGSVIWLVIFFPISFIMGMCALYILLSEPKCPNCHGLFLAKNYPLNIGFSIYTKKCTTCGYKLK